MMLLKFFGAAFALWFVYTASLMNGSEHAYRLTIAVDTPDGVKSASSVVRVFQDTRKGLLPNTGGGSTVTGEAIVLDLGGGKNLVALLAPSDIVSQAFAPRGKLILPEDIRTLTGKVELRRELIPTLVNFDNLNDPASAKVVFGRQIRTISVPNSGGNTRRETIYIDEFQTIIGSGYSFRYSTLEIVSTGIWPLNRLGITGERITRGIADKLPWIGNYKIETTFERLLRASNGEGGSLQPGMNLRREF